MINQHSFSTLYLLENIDEFRDIANWAAYHHERLDGSEYPFGLAGGDIPPEARTLAVSDIYQALREPRPHRAPKEREEAFAILGKMAANDELDSDIVRALRESSARWSDPGAPE